jgi:hypothetical protein
MTAFSSAMTSYIHGVLNYGIFLGSNDLQLQEVIKETQDLGLNIEDQSHPVDYVGVNIKKLKDGSYEFTQ